MALGDGARLGGGQAERVLRRQFVFQWGLIERGGIDEIGGQRHLAQQFEAARRGRGENEAMSQTRRGFGQNLRRRHAAAATT
jgi:hypothetical protein